VRSVNLDIWSDKQMALMEHGGNHKLNEFYDKFDLLSQDIKIKYNTKAAQWYRKTLAANAFGSPNSFTEPEPDYDEGKKLIESSGAAKEGTPGSSP
jgi:hypothetical protein